MPTLVVAALSARLLAESARRGGYDVIALDLFGDLDTRRAARSWQSIGSPQAMRLDGCATLAALAEARDEAPDAAWIAGAGFEAQPDLLERGATILPLLGNDAATTQRVRQPRVFFALLDTLGVPHPEVAWRAPSDPRGWLRKDAAGSGGWEIRRAHDAADEVDPRADVQTAARYFQRERPGLPMSVLFLADGRHARTIGLNELLVAPRAASPFVYHGAVGPAPAPAQGARLQAAVDSIVAATALRGLASLDFVSDGTHLDVLEVNPRPSATMALYDADFPRGLVHAHVEACGGRLPETTAPRPDGAPVRGERIVFASRDCVLDERAADMLLALGCHDVSASGTRFAAAAPVCSVSAHGRTCGEVRAELARRQSTVLSIVQNRTGP
jgi:predicted ATP-grasp superfamily ATP-dependent carboligase